MHEDIEESGLQGGKTLGDHLYLLSFVIGIPMLIVGVLSCVNMLFNMGMIINSATIILVIITTIIGALMTIGGYFLYTG